jgi:hypothetical protein
MNMLYKFAFTEIWDKYYIFKHKRQPNQYSQN